MFSLFIKKYEKKIKYDQNQLEMYTFFNYLILHIREKKM